MTIYLPDNISGFRQAFDETCERILSNGQDIAFYTLLIQFVSTLRGHPLLKDSIHSIETEHSKLKLEFDKASLEAIEDSWRRLWKYHCKSLRHRKQLAHIKRIVTAPSEISYSPLYNRMLSRLWQFQFNSPLCRYLSIAPVLFRSAQSAMPFGPIRTTKFLSKNEIETIPQVMRSPLPLKLAKKDKRHKLHLHIAKSNQKKKQVKRTWSVERLPGALYSPKIMDIEQKNALPGHNNNEKRKHMRLLAETNIAFCWERIRYLEQCCTIQGHFQALKHHPGKWLAIRNVAWNSALERCEIEALLGAKMSLNQKLSSEPNSSIDVFLLCEHQIFRRDYEKYLSSFKSHVHNLLFKIENTQHSTCENPSLLLPGTQKEDFVVDLATKYWNANPFAKRDEVFQDYIKKCPISRLLSRHRWDQIIRKRKLDPRPKEAIKRGKGKKTLQK